MGLKLAALAAAAASLVASPGDYLAARQQTDGGFAEPGSRSDPALTAWAVLGLDAAGRTPRRSSSAYLREAPIADTTDLALRVLALRALGEDVGALTARLERQRRRDGRIGSLVNSTAWAAIALRKPGAATVRYLRRVQHRSGGWSWAPRGSPDSNDTAAAIQALRASGVRGRPIRRGLGYLRRLAAPNGGVRLTTGREPDAQSTAWAIQAYVAAGAKPPRAAFRFLASLRRPDGSYRYSRRYAVTPAIVTAQVLPALARKSFPLQDSSRRPGRSAPRTERSARSPSSASPTWPAWVSWARGLARPLRCASRADRYHCGPRPGPVPSDRFRVRVPGRSPGAPTAPGRDAVVGGAGRHPQPSDVALLAAGLAILGAASSEAVSRPSPSSPASRCSAAPGSTPIDHR
jgi:hypothetical protein